MKKYLLGLMLLAAFTAPTLAHATFVLDPDPSIDPDTFMFLDGTPNPTTSLTGHVGSQTGNLINITTDSVVNVVGSGFATIQDVGGTLSRLVFTPGDSTKYGDFSFRGQLSTDGKVFLSIVDQIGAVFNFDITEQANQNFARFGAISYDGEWLTSATIYTDTFFKEVKQIEFSLQENPAPIPEPGTMVLLGAGFIGLAIYGKRRRNLA